MWFVVTGVRQGETFKAGSQGSPLHFNKGMIEVPDEARDLHNLLRNFYEAHPAHECEKGEDGTIVWKGPAKIANTPEIPVALRELTGAEGGGDGADGGKVPAEPPAFDKPAKPKK